MLPCSDDIGQQPLGLPINGPDISADLLQRAQRLWLVEVPSEAQFVSHPGGAFLDPGVGRVGQHFSENEGLDAAFFQERHLLGVPQLGVRFVLGDGTFAFHAHLEEAVQWAGLDLAGLVYLGNDGRRRVDPPADCLENALEVGGGQADILISQRGSYAPAEDVVILEQRVAEC